MSNQNLLFLSSDYCKNESLSIIDKQIIVFLKERGHEIINLDYFKNRAASQVYEQTLGLLKTKPLVIAIIKQPVVLSLVLIAAAIFKNCPTFVFCQDKYLTEFKSITSTYLHVYEFKKIENIVNTLKLLRL